MGGSKSKENRRPTEEDLDGATFDGQIWPYHLRHSLIHLINSMVAEDAIDDAIAKTDELKKLFGLASSSPGTSEPAAFIMDQSGRDMVLNLESLLTDQPEDWRHQAAVQCSKLLTHITPPQIRGKFPEGPDVEEIDLSGVDLYLRQINLDKVIQFLEENQSITRVELGYTGITNDTVHVLFPKLAKLPHLQYIGLQGNRLDTRIISRFVQFLQHRNQFPQLRWVDLRNNHNIYTLPRLFLELLRERWKSVTYMPSFRDLSEGRTVIMNDGSTSLNV